MSRKMFVVILCLLMLLVAGCSNEPEEPAATEQEIAHEDLYEQIETGMEYDEVMAIMAGHEPLLENEGAINTPTGQITTQNVSWKFGDDIITAIFQDGVLLGKDLTKM